MFSLSDLIEEVCDHHSENYSIVTPEKVKEGVILLKVSVRGFLSGEDFVDGNPTSEYVEVERIDKTSRENIVCMVPLTDGQNKNLRVPLRLVTAQEYTHGEDRNPVRYFINKSQKSK